MKGAQWIWFLQCHGAPGMSMWRATGWRERRGTSFTSSMRTWRRWGEHMGNRFTVLPKHVVQTSTIPCFLPQNPRREVERIMRYLDLSVSDEVISRIVTLTSFKNMKENPMANYTCIPAPVFDHSISPFMRKGASVCSILIQWISYNVMQLNQSSLSTLQNKFHKGRTHYSVFSVLHIVQYSGAS